MLDNARRRLLIPIAALAFAAGTGAAQVPSDRVDADNEPIVPAPTSSAIGGSPFNENRILGVLPDFQTVTDPLKKAPPLTRRQKWTLAWKETADPFNLFSAALGAGFSQAGNQTPRYGYGGQAYAKRFAAAIGDFATQNAFSAGVLASVLHQDPRYFRKGPESRIPSRVLYSISRIVITRQDSGRSAFNASGIFGMALGIGASNLYYPSASVRGSVMVGRLHTSLMGGVTGNLLSEFWPDLQRKFFHKRPRK